MGFHDLIISSIATIIAEILTLPICTVKTIYQTNLKYKSIIDVCKVTYKNRGLLGFYNASLPAIASQTVSTSTKFTSYMFLRSVRHIAPDDIMNNIINGIGAGIISSVFTHPFDVIKIHKQNGLSFSYELKRHGLSLFYRGWSKSLSKSIILTSIIFPMYDFYKFKIKNILVAAALSSITATVILQPIDYLKVRHISGEKLYQSNMGLISTIRYFYRGFHVNLSRVIPHFTITMSLIDLFKNNLKF